jgi:hypothetical protein
MDKIVYMLTDMVNEHPCYIIHLNEENIKLLETKVTFTENVEFNNETQKNLNLQINVTNTSKINN